MANTVVGFTIQIDGINSINDLNEAIKTTKEQMNALDITTAKGQKEFEELSQTLGELTAQQKALKKAQDDVNKSFLPEKAAGAYDALSAKLNKLRKDFKNAALDGSASADELDKMQKEIQQLDKTLKDVDGQVGQFQRNVGNYPKTFSRITRSLYTTIPGFEAFSDTLKDGEGRLTTFGKALIGGFVAFQAINLIGRAIGNLDEFIKKINETKETVAQFSGAAGEDLSRITATTSAIAQTFDTDAQSISAAAEALSKKLGIGFEEALGKLEGALVEGKGNANDYLSTITQYPETFKDATGAVTDFSEQNKNLLGTNKELAASQVNVAERLQGLSDGFKNAKNIVTTGLLVALVQIIDIFKPVGAAFYNLWKTIEPLFASFKTAGEETSTFGKIINLLLFPIKVLAGQLQILADGIAWVFSGFKNLIDSSPFLQNVFSRIRDVITSVYTAMINLPSVFAGVVSAIKQLGINFVNFFTDLYLQAQIFGQQVKGAFGADVDAAIKDLQRQRDRIKSEGKSIAEAYSDGYNKAKEAADKAAEAQKKKATVAIQKIDTEAIKKAQEAQRDAQKKLEEDRKKFLEKEQQDTKARFALLADLRSRYLEEQIKNIKDDRERQIKEIRLGAEQQVKALDEQFQKLQEENAKRAAEGEKLLQDAVKLYKDGSMQVKKIREENSQAVKQAGEDEKAIAQEIGNIKTEIQKKANSDIEKLNADFRQEDLDKAMQAAEDLRQFRDKVLQEEQQYIDMVSEMRQLKNKETLDKMLAQEKDAKKREEIIRVAAEQEIADQLATARNKLQSLSDAESQLLDEQGNLRVGIAQEEYDAILLAKQKLNTEIAGLEKEQTENTRAEAEKRLKANVDTFNEILGYFKQGLDIFAQALEAANERQQAQFDAEIERSEQRQEALQEEIDNSTGLRRRFYEERLESEIAAQQKLEKAKEDLAKKAAKQQKALAIIQSIINTALAVSAALTLVPPNPAAPVIAGIVGAAQTAIIAAQPLARGGVVGKLSGEVVQFANGGKVTSSGNIRPLSNGDNVLATLKTGEVVLNEDQQRRIGYSTLKAARIPNFAGGGVVGAPTAFVSERMSAMTEERNRLLLMEQLLQETSNRIDRIQVVYTASTEDSVDKARTERKEIKVNAQF